jgi:hypothetical protein
VIFDLYLSWSSSFCSLFFFIETFYSLLPLLISLYSWDGDAFLSCDKYRRKNNWRSMRSDEINWWSEEEARRRRRWNARKLNRHWKRVNSLDSVSLDTIRYAYRIIVSKRFRRYMKLPIQQHGTHRFGLDLYRIVRFVSWIVRYWNHWVTERNGPQFY